jgi:hypothetical protein
MGWEFEYEGVSNKELPNHTFADFWEYHEERSLYDRGAEYVFATPLFGADAYNALAWLVDHAKKQGWRCTKRTGIHVHQDVRDLEVPQLAGLCILYAALEPLIYRWIGDGRDTSHFCIPLYNADETLVDVCKIIKSAIADDKSGGNLTLALSDSYKRYAGFNLQSLSKFGSIEYRHMQTTHDLDRIINWGNIILSLKAAARKLPQSDGAVVRMLERMDIYDVLHYVFPPHIVTLLQTPDAYSQFVEDGLSSARDIAVHGCSTKIDWVRSFGPKGENRGFKIWVSANKTEKEKKIQDWIDDVERDDDGDGDGENVNQEARDEGELFRDFHFEHVAVPGAEAINRPPGNRVNPPPGIDEMLARFNDALIRPNQRWIVQPIPQPQGAGAVVAEGVVPPVTPRR